MTADPSLIGLRGNMFSRMSVEKRTNLPMPLPNVVAISYDAFVFISPYKGFINYIVYFFVFLSLWLILMSIPWQALHHVNIELNGFGR